MAASQYKARSALRNPAHFPSFLDLPNDQTINYNYFFLGAKCQYQPIRHWCFIGEITDDQFARDSFSRNLIQVKDVSNRDGIPVFFYRADGNLDFDELRVGGTFCLRYAQSHFFSTRNSAFAANISTMSWSFLQSFLLSWRYRISNPTVGSKKCWSCDSEPSELLTCARCKVARYCGKACQSADWASRHKRWCKALPKYMDLVGIDYNKWEGQYIPFQA
eukprot:Em0021g166a